MNKRTRTGAMALCVLAMTAATPPAGADIDDALRDRMIERIEREMDAQQWVGVSIGIVQDGEVAATFHRGWEDRENEIEASDATMYRWASISKPLTAVVAIKLADGGALDLDCDVREYVPEFPEKPWPITARQLLCHQGGVVHYTNGRVIRTEREYDVEHPFADTVVSLDRFNESPLVCEPGTKYSYTTHGYMLLGAACQRAGGKPYAELVNEMIAEPLGMTSLQPDYQWHPIDHRTPGYRRVANGRIVRSFDRDVSWKLPGGGWISNVGDLAQFAAGLMGDELLTDDLKDQLWTRQKTADGSETSYGLGFLVVSAGGMKIVAHGGSQEKTRTAMRCIPEHGAAVVIMCNTEGADLGTLSNDLLKMLVLGDAAGTVDDRTASATPVSGQLSTIDPRP